MGTVDNIKGKEKIAILGGGVAAMTAAFELTSTPELRARHEITVYQVGWRLGGKGASGRNAQEHDRIEEHGLHIMLGCYHNTFKVLRACYKELGREPRTPLATVEEAFERHDFVPIADEVDGVLEPWPLSFPPRPGKPGEDDPGVLPPIGYVKELIEWAWKQLKGSEVAPTLERDVNELEARYGLEEGSRDALDPAERARRVEKMIDELTSSRDIGQWWTYLKAAGHVTDVIGDFIAKKIKEVMAQLESTFIERAIDLLEDFREGAGFALRSVTKHYRPWILLDLATSTLIGMLKDLVRADRDWMSIDDRDLREWLKDHGASQETYDSALVRAIYNLVFTRPGEMAAGSLLHGMMRMMFGYKGTVFYKMQAGMGDTIFAPLYQVLKKRGVKFKFFHRVKELHLSQDKRRIDAIDVGIQVRPSGEDYDPLYNVKGLPCWPSKPLYDRIENGEELKDSGQNLESHWNTWPDVDQKTLELGKDFDWVVLGISIGAFPHICKQLMDARQPFREMVENVKTTQTQAAQLWLKPDLSKLGWKLDSPVLDGFAEPFDTWADMTHLLPRESWPAEATPGHLAYLCSHLDDDGQPPQEPCNYAEQQHERAKENTKSWLEESARKLWPGAAGPEGRGFDWSLLVDTKDREGAARLDAQYWQATSCPSERYVLGVPGSSKYRLRAHESGFENLVLAGDWVRTGLNAGCAEAATMAGMQASRAICRVPAVIPGDDDPETRPSVDVARHDPEPPPGVSGPRYVERSGELVIRQPLGMRGVTMYAFFLDADKDRLAEVVDRHLNEPAKGAVRYVPAAPCVGLVCADIARGQACEEPDRSKGWLGERDVAFWIPLWAGRQDGADFKPDRLVFFLPYIFADNIAATISGRETYGFHKETGILQFPARPGFPGPFAVDTLLIRRHDVESKAEDARLIDIEPADAGASLLEAFDEVASGLSDIAKEMVELGLKGFIESAEALVRAGRPGEARMVFLKQFRDVADPERACYQAIVEAPAVTKEVRRGGLLPKHRVRIAPADSHPIVKDLGLSGAVIESRLAAWIDFDFVMQRGEVVWSAGGATRETQPRAPAPSPPPESSKPVDPKNQPQPPAADGVRRHALVIGINKYDRTSPDLRGCVNDATSVRKLLVHKLAVPEDRITLLSSPAASPAQEATAANIRASFDALAKSDAVRPGDHVILFYASHGVRLERQNPEAPRQRYYGLIAKDADTSGEGLRNLILDREINRFLRELQGRSVSATVIADTCHSGASTREIGVRSVAVDPLSDSAWEAFEATHPALGARDASPGLDGAAAPADRVGKDRALGADFVTLAACRDTETAKEVRAKDGTQAKHGALTASLLDLLSKEPPEGLQRLRWSDIEEELSAAVAGYLKEQGKSSQTPAIEGEPARTVFGGRWTPNASGFTARGSDGVYIIEGGTVHGLGVGAEVDIYPYDTPDFEASKTLPVRAVIEDATLSTSTAKPKAPHAQLDKARARLVKLAPDSERKLVRFVGVPSKILDAATLGESETASFIKVAPPGEPAHLEVRPYTGEIPAEAWGTELDGETLTKTAEYFNGARDGWVLVRSDVSGAPGRLPADFKAAPDNIIAYLPGAGSQLESFPEDKRSKRLGAALRDGLVHYACYLRTRDRSGGDDTMRAMLDVKLLAGKEADAPPEKASSLPDNVTSKLRSVVPQEGVYHVCEGQWLFLKVAVRKPTTLRLYAGVVHCSDDGNVKAVWPPKGEDYTFESDKLTHIGEDRFNPLFLNRRADQSVSYWTLKLIAYTAPEGSPPIDLQSLDQEQTVQDVFALHLTPDRASAGRPPKPERPAGYTWDFRIAVSKADASSDRTPRS